MVLAEALLRVPDNATADRLIEDKLRAADFSHHEVRSESLLVSASAWALGLSARIQPGETPESIVASLVGGSACRRCAPRRARRCGCSAPISCSARASARRSTAPPRKDPRYSFDMLGEGARTAADADRYFAAYAARSPRSAGAAAIGAARPARHLGQAPALHPRFEAVSRERVLRELVPRVVELARAAKDHDLNFTIDAEEADRLELTLEVTARVLADPSLAGWHGFGLAIQAYQKRSLAVVDWVDALAEAHRPPDGAARSRAPTGTPRSSARRSAGCPTIRSSPASR